MIELKIDENMNNGWNDINNGLSRRSEMSNNHKFKDEKEK